MILFYCVQPTNVTFVGMKIDEINVHSQQDVKANIPQSTQMYEPMVAHMAK